MKDVTTYEEHVTLGTLGSMTRLSRSRTLGKSHNITQDSMRVYYLG
jgi:hypothetical protein